MRSLEIEVDVNEAYINRVTPGQPVQVTLNAYPDERIPAEVIAIIPAADRNKATVRVRVGCRARFAMLPDMGVRVAFLEERVRAPSAPQQACWCRPACTRCRGDSSTSVGPGATPRRGSGRWRRARGCVGLRTAERSCVLERCWPGSGDGVGHADAN